MTDFGEIEITLVEIYNVVIITSNTPSIVRLIWRKVTYSRLASLSSGINFEILRFGYANFLTSIMVSMVQLDSVMWSNTLVIDLDGGRLAGLARRTDQMGNYVIRIYAYTSP